MHKMCGYWGANCAVPPVWHYYPWGWWGHPPETFKQLGTGDALSNKTNCFNFLRTATGATALSSQQRSVMKMKKYSVTEPRFANHSLQKWRWRINKSYLTRSSSSLSQGALLVGAGWCRLVMGPLCWHLAGDRTLTSMSMFPCLNDFN